MSLRNDLTKKKSPPYLQVLPLLKEIIEEVKLLKEAPKLKPEGAYVLVYELLIGQVRRSSLVVSLSTLV
jgi:hypothetical protein